MPTEMPKERMEVARDAALNLVKKRMDKIKTELAKDNPDKCFVEIQYKTVETTFEELQTFWTGILEKMLHDKCTPAQYGVEREKFDKFNEDWTAVTLCVERFLQNDSPAPSQHSQRSGGSGTSSASSKKRTFKLPKIELKKFSGELTEWLGWWSQFQKIHEDEDLHITDKFHYLLQAMVAGSRAKDLVESYPMTEENYPKAIQALQQRFGKKKLLKQVYVRELLKIVINNSKSNEKVRISKMYDKLESHLRALETLGVTPEQTAEFIFPMVESSLPEDILMAWQRSPLYGQKGSEMNPPRTELYFLMKFLRQEVESEGQRNLVRAGFEPNQSKDKKKSGSSNPKKEEFATASGLFSGMNQMCIFCEKAHSSPDCFKAQTMSTKEKNDKVKEKKCCYICLRFGHMSKDCKSFIKCLLCSKKHLVIMCPDLAAHQKKLLDPKPATEESPAAMSSQRCSAMTSHQCSGDVLLQTILVRISNGDESKHRVVRLVFDNGSQGTSIRKDTTQKLGLQEIEKVWSRKILYGGKLTDKQQHSKFRIKLSSKDGKNPHELIVLDEPEICGMLRRIPQGPWLKELTKMKIQLSDFKSESSEIEILVGSDYFGKLMTGRLVHLQCGLTAMESVFGWTLSGRLPKKEDSTAMLSLSTSLLSFQSSVSDLWSLETIGIMDAAQVKNREEREEATRVHFQETVSRDQEGRYTVRLPWIYQAPQIPHNKAVATRRLENTTQKLVAANKYNEYNKVFQDWLMEGIIEPVDEINVSADEDKTHYLPHRAVFKPESITTPVRPVFDASCKTGRNPSLNECLEKGPNLLELIPSILLRFREKKVGILSDIRKAFQMIDVHQDDRDYLRFLWWEDTEKKIRVLRHKRVVFGVNCSPFLLGAVLEKHLKTEDTPLSKKLLKSLYVDNCATSVDSHQEYEDFRKESVSLLATAKMELRQWECSSVEGTGISSPSGECGLVSDRDCTPQALTTVLGLKWHKLEDTLGVDIPQENLPEKISKRIVLSLVQKIFDPLGFLSPTTLVPKLLLQMAWSLKTSWDEELVGEFRTEFQKWWMDIKILQQVQIPRFAFKNASVDSRIQFHTFCDASKKSYAAAVFVRIDNGNEVSVQLLQAKARVAPLKPVTIPRLELLGCCIGARLLSSVKQALSSEKVPSFLWSDSTTALAWIRRNDEWGTFVGNRVKDICSLTDPKQWNYVPGDMNPADLPSRGCTPSQLLKSRWWEGPEWLKGPQDETWPSNDEEFDEESIKIEKKKGAMVSMEAVDTEIPWYLKRHSSYTENLREFTWIMRYYKNLRLRGDASTQREKSKELTALELHEAEIKLFLFVQKEAFEPEVNVKSKSKSKGKKNKIISGLKTELDEKGLIRVRSKLIYRDDTECFRRPILLPHSHPLVEQLIREEHTKNGHGGAQFLMGKIREKCWIVQSRKAIRKIISSCVICRRFATKKPNVPPASLPENRVKTARVFQISGVDLAGPLYLKDQSKTWMVIFTCAVYRCIHLELVDSLSTDAFLLALYRFISRRGRPSTMYSDNGTNFVGADNIMKTMDWEKIVVKTRVNRIQWVFSPPSAAWWGGWWERLIRSCKDLIKRMLGQNRLSYIQLETCLCQVEAIMNDRPLTFVTEDGDDLIPLTPSMFLNEIQETDFPEAEVLDTTGLNGKYRSLNVLREELRQRFRKEYLSQLVQRGKDKKIVKFQIGDVVLIGDDDKKRLQWLMGRIVELYPGRDGEIRVGKVKTATGYLVRPLQRLYPLEVSMPSDDYPVTNEVTKVAAKKKKKKEQVPVPEIEVEPEVRTRSGRKVNKPARLGM